MVRDPDDGDDDDDDAAADNEEPPAKRRKSRTSTDLNQIWRLYNDSIEIDGLSLSMLVRSRMNDREAGTGENSTAHWLKKIFQMYIKRAGLSFRDVGCYNLVCDASRHSTQDCLVGVFLQS